MINEVCEGKITAAKNLQAEKTTLMNERLAINARESAKSLELNRIITKINTLKNTKVDQLKAQLTKLGSKVNSADVNSVTFQESLAIRSLYWMLEKTLGETLDATYTGYLTNLEALEAR